MNTPTEINGYPVIKSQVYGARATLLIDMSARHGVVTYWGPKVWQIEEGSFDAVAAKNEATEKRFS